MSPVFQTTEHDLDAIAFFVTPFVIFGCLLIGLPAIDSGAYSFVFSRLRSQPAYTQSVRRQQPAADCPTRSEMILAGNFQGFGLLGANILLGAFDAGMAEQELGRAQVAGLLVDMGREGPA